ncbi:lipoprotein insertase outer membrane protein LolB [Ottowia sp.]|uniref:lipoprotein insertase outer membrane protein LolB n=1 Tax=Ottowia sp. TaxID=1898956 RepID=UPI003A89D86E
MRPALTPQVLVPHAPRAPAIAWWHLTGNLAGILIALITTLLIAGCANLPSEKYQFDPSKNEWSGRLALTVHSDPPQSYSAGFTLQGSAEQGELSLNAPLGNLLAVMQWQPGQAVLRQGDATHRYASLSEMTSAATGDTGDAALPISALFNWLHGQQHAAAGWSADLSRLPEGRLIARRLMPLPTAELRVVLDQP